MMMMMTRPNPRGGALSPPKKDEDIVLEGPHVVEPYVCESVCAMGFLETSSFHRRLISFSPRRNDIRK